MKLGVVIGLIGILGMAPLSGDADQGSGNGHGKGHGGSSHHGKMRGNRMGSGMGRGWLKGLNLTAEQKTKVDQIFKDSMPKMKVKRQGVKTKIEALRAAFMSGASSSDLRSKHADLHGAQNEMAMEKFSRKLAIRDTLTDEQKKKMADWWSDHHKAGMMGGQHGEMDEGDE